MNYKKLVVAFSGPSNSGKTTAIVKVSTFLQKKGFKVCIIKHDPANKAVFDYEGKDSYRFSNTGANVAVVSPSRTTLFKKQTSGIDEIIDMFEDFDYLLIEGLKTLPYPRITISREKIDESYFEFTDAIACDKTIDTQQIPATIDILDLNNIQDLVSWIDKNAKRV